MLAETSDEDENGNRRLRLSKNLGGAGVPLTIRFGGEAREIADGAGLCFPGRWAFRRRRIPQWRGIEPLQAKLVAILQEEFRDCRELIL